MSTISGVNGSGNGAWAAVQAQRSQHQARMFAKVDTDGNGSVNQSELDTMLSDISQRAGVNFGDSKELFSKMDANADGSLSSDELKSGMKQLMPPPSTMEFANSRRQDGVGAEGGETDDLFSKVDNNSDGSIDASELKAFADKIKSDTGQDVSERLGKLDTDGDDKVSKGEFEAGRPKGPEGTGGKRPAHGPQGAGGPPPAGGPGGAQPASASSSTTYDPLDTNQDGTVSEMERLAGALKELAQSTQSDSSGNTEKTEIAKLAQKLYDQISASMASQSSESSLSALA